MSRSDFQEGKVLVYREKWRLIKRKNPNNFCPFGSSGYNDWLMFCTCVLSGPTDPGAAAVGAVEGGWTKCWRRPRIPPRWVSLSSSSVTNFLFESEIRIRLTRHVVMDQAHSHRYPIYIFFSMLWPIQIWMLDQSSLLFKSASWEIQLRLWHDGNQSSHMLVIRFLLMNPPQPRLLLSPSGQKNEKLQLLGNHLQGVLREHKVLRQRLMRPLALTNLPVLAHLHA